MNNSNSGNLLYFCILEFQGSVVRWCDFSVDLLLFFRFFFYRFILLFHRFVFFPRFLFFNNVPSTFSRIKKENIYQIGGPISKHRDIRNKIRNAPRNSRSLAHTTAWTHPWATWRTAPWSAAGGFSFCCFFLISCSDTQVLTYNFLLLLFFVIVLPN